MARFVLVHGGFSGAWIWSPLIDSLKVAGHSGEAFDLPGMGDDRREIAGAQPENGEGRTIWIADAHRGDGKRFMCVQMTS